MIKDLVIVEKVILDLWKNHIKESVITQIDAKTKLQELALKKFKKLPTYKLSLIQGHVINHYLRLVLNFLIQNFIWSGKSKKDAEQNAAIECLKSIK